MAHDDELRMNLVANLVRVRNDKGLSQCKLAALLDVSQGFIALIESGRRPIPENLMLKIQEVLDVSSEQLLQKAAPGSNITAAKVWSVFGQVTGNERCKALEILQAYVESSPEDRKRLYQAVCEIVLPSAELSISDRLKMKRDKSDKDLVIGKPGLADFAELKFGLGDDVKIGRINAMHLVEESNTPDP